MSIETVTAPNPGPFTLDGTKSYVIDARVVVDPGPEIDSHIAALRAAAPELCAIVITHRHGDHAPAASALRRAGVMVYAPEGALPSEFVDHIVHDDETIECGGARLRAIATPGHTAEHFCYLTPDGELFTGDTVLGSGTTVIFPPDGDMGAYLRTLEKLIALQPRAIYPGHGPVRNDAVALLHEYLDHRRMRERQIVEALDDSRAIPSLRERIYPQLDSRLTRAAELQLEAHLVHLVERGEVKRQGEMYTRA